jgi:hypothetical protein
MSATPEELESAAEDAALANYQTNGVKSYKIGSREKVMHDPLVQAQAAAFYSGLNSPRRGMNLGKIDRPA